jgi:PDZ domain
MRERHGGGEWGDVAVGLKFLGEALLVRARMKTHAPFCGRGCRVASLVVALVLVPGLSAQLRDTAPGPALIEEGPEERPALKEVPFLGISTHVVDTELAAKRKLSRNKGLVVGRVMAGSPADGLLKAEDVLTHLDGEVLVDPRQLGVLIRSRAEGVGVALTVVRAGKEQVVRVKLGKRAMPPLPERAKRALP